MPDRRLLAAMLVFMAGASAGRAQDLPAGGKWVRSPYTDPASDRKLIRFVLEPDDAEFGRRPQIAIICTGSGQPFVVAYAADTRLTAEFKNALNYDAPAMNVRIRLDENKAHKVAWDILPDGKSAVIDAKTAKALLTGRRLRVRIRDFVDSYTLSGLDAAQVREACGDKWYVPPPLGK